MRFSERYGYKPVREIIQKESIDDQLKNALWSIFHLFIYLFGIVSLTKVQIHIHKILISII
ncbi:AbiJ-NTD4 domain-containing protein [Acinetobacter faecalis]|nr:hypothetical protein [Acinetobacter faecalis]MDY6460311.1 hypothetical protein [Acinetobacter faecalis]